MNEWTLWQKLDLSHTDAVAMFTFFMFTTSTVCPHTASSQLFFVPKKNLLLYLLCTRAAAPQLDFESVQVSKSVGFVGAVASYGISHANPFDVRYRSGHRVNQSVAIRVVSGETVTGKVVTQSVQRKRKYEAHRYVPVLAPSVGLRRIKVWLI